MKKDQVAIKSGYSLSLVLKAPVPDQEFQLQEVLEQAGKNIPNSPFFTEFERNELSNNPSR